jgi:hypothetical protein
MSVFHWLGLILALAAVAGLAAADRRFWSAPRRRALGQVIGHRRMQDVEGTLYSAEVRFVAEDGQTHEIVDELGRGAPQPPVGTRVRVVYPAGAAGAARIAGRPWRFLAYVFLILAAGLIVAGGMGWLR